MPKEKDIEDLMLAAWEVVKEAEKNARNNPKTDFIQVVVVEPTNEPYKKTIPNNLAAMQEIVGGYIEHVTIGETEKGARVTITINEEGKLLGLPMNRIIASYDVLVGTFFIGAYNLEGDAISLTDAECERYINLFKGTNVYI